MVPLLYTHTLRITVADIFSEGPSQAIRTQTYILVFTIDTVLNSQL